MNYINTYHFLNPHLHNMDVNKLHDLKNVYNTIRKPPTICKHQDEVMLKCKATYLFTDLVFENHVVYYPRHIHVIEDKYDTGPIIINTDTTPGDPYFHFMTESLPSVLYLQNNNIICPIVTRTNAFVEPIFRFFGIDEPVLDVVPVNVNRIVKQPYIEHDYPSPEKIELIRNVVTAKVIFEKKIGIFLVIKEKSGNIMNSDDVLDILKSTYCDVEWHVFNSQSIQETVDLFSKAKIIVGPHGAAGFTNMLFSSNEITIIEFMDIDKPEICYWHLSEMLRNKYYMIPCKTTNGNFLMDLEETKTILP